MSIRRTLQLWLLAGVTLCTLTTGWMAYRVMRDEANELFDRQLRQLVVTVPHEFTHTTLTPPDPEAEDDIVVQVWNANNQLRYLAPTGIRLPRATVSGYSDMLFRDRRWRVYAQEHAGNFIQAAQPYETRDELAGRMAFGATAPFLLLIPALLILIWFVIRRGLRPLSDVTQAVGRRSLDSLQPIAVDETPPEIRPLLDALNDLLARLERAWSSQRNFVADAAHELRTPLTALKLQLQRAEKTADAQQRALAYHKLHERLDRTTHVVQQLLTLARQEPQHPTADTIAKADPIAIATRCIGDFAPLAETKHIELSLDTDLTRPADVAMSPESLRILLENLIDNAIRYTPAAGRVKVSITNTDTEITLSISDSGPGILPEDRQRVFDRFYRREDSGEMGSGLGLAIAKAIVERYAARMDLSETEGGGTTVRLVFTPAKTA